MASNICKNGTLVVDMVDLLELDNWSVLVLPAVYSKNSPTVNFP